jgi:hypothetical protein
MLALSVYPAVMQLLVKVIKVLVVKLLLKQTLEAVAVLELEVVQLCQMILL